MIELEAMGKIDIGEILTEALGTAWAKFWYYVSFQFVDPFWWWLVAVIVYVSALTVALALWRFYFGALPSWLQKLLGLSVFGAIAGLFIYAKGERDAREHDAAKPKPKPKPAPKLIDGGPTDGGWNPFGKW